MKRRLSRCALLLVAAAASVAAPQFPQDLPPPPLPGQSEPDPKLPNGKSQRDAILKQEHERNLKDSAQLVQLTQDLQADIEKYGPNVLPISTLKKIDEIDKLVKKIRSRLRHD